MRELTTEQRLAIYQTSLHRAVARGDAVRVARFLSEGCDPNLLDGRGWSPLSTAIMCDRLDMVDVLVDGGANIDLPGISGATPLREAIGERKDAFVDKLRARGATVGPRDAALMADAALLDSLLKATDADRRAETASRALAYAARAGSLACIAVASEHGANVDSADEKGWTPLMGAVINRDPETRGVIVAELIRRGANVNARTAGGSTALHTASGAGYLDAVEALVAAGADIEAALDASNQTPLFGAAMSGRADVVKYLVEHGANRCLRNTKGHSPLSLARSQGASPEVIALLDDGSHGLREQILNVPFSIYEGVKIEKAMALSMQMRETGFKFQKLRLSVEIRARLLRLHRRACAARTYKPDWRDDDAHRIEIDFKAILKDAAAESDDLLLALTEKAEGWPEERLRMSAIERRQSPSRSYTEEIRAIDLGNLQTRADMQQEMEVRMAGHRKAKELTDEACRALGITTELVVFGEDAEALADDTWP